MQATERRSARVTIRRLAPTRTWVPPGRPVTIEAVVAADRGIVVRIGIELLDIDRVVVHDETRRRLRAGDTRLRLPVAVPDTPRRGYGVRLHVRSSGGETLARAVTALEALDGWWESPRHVALIDHTHHGTRQVPDLGAWHVTVAQAYDWMWRHYRYEPPSGEDPFTDPLGRRVSHTALRATIRAAARIGIATLAYGSVYGAEAEHVARHPDDRVFDDAGEPLSLGGTFFINDIRPASAWRRRLLDEYRRAMRRFGFAGIHMDTYGPPYQAVGADGGTIDFRELYPGLIAEAAQEVGAVRGGRVLFNCVEGFPLEDVAAAPVAALYLELWPPDDTFRHLVTWVDQARAVAGGRQVIIAAYGAPWRTADTRAARHRAAEATLLATCVISAAGAYHHTLASGDRVLVEGYYPAAIRMRTTEARALRAAWRFGARYLHLLTGTARDEELERVVRLTGRSGEPIPVSTAPMAGSVWVRASRAPGGRPVIQLVDLREQPDDRWDLGKAPSPILTGWRLECPGLIRPVAASPWASDGEPRALDQALHGWRLPRARRWLLVTDGEVASA